MNSNDYLTMSMLNELGYAEMQLVKDFDDQQKMYFLSEYKKRKKNTTAALLLGIFIGDLGAHHFYLGNSNRGILYIFICFMNLFLAFIFIGVITAFIFKVITWIEMIDISKKVDEANHSIACDLSIKIKNSFSNMEIVK